MFYYFISYICIQFVIDNIQINNLVHLSYQTHHIFGGNGFFLQNIYQNWLASLHYVTFIEPLVVCPTEALSFDSDEFMNNAINKVIEEKYQWAYHAHRRTFLCGLFGVQKILRSWIRRSVIWGSPILLRTIKLVTKYLWIINFIIARLY
jgi:hypothetical protein